jgi:acyl carrier protein
MGFFDWLDLDGSKRLEAVFGGRPSLTPDEFYTEYFERQGYPKDLVVKVKEAFDRVIEFDLSRLASDDDFSKELRFIWDSDSLADVEILEALEREFGIELTMDESQQMSTISDVIRIISAKISPDQSGGGKYDSVAS